MMVIPITVLDVYGLSTSTLIRAIEGLNVTAEWSRLVLKLKAISILFIIVVLNADSSIGLNLLQTIISTRLLNSSTDLSRNNGYIFKRNMKIVICGSRHFHDDIRRPEKKLQ